MATRWAGVYTVVATGCPVGFGNHTQWDLKLDGRLAQAILSIQAHKGVEMGRVLRWLGAKGPTFTTKFFTKKDRVFTGKAITPVALKAE
jgi:chorismate synthase